jgi:hypothetical protein
MKTAGVCGEIIVTHTHRTPVPVTCYGCGYGRGYDFEDHLIVVAHTMYNII